MTSQEKNPFEGIGDEFDRAFAARAEAMSRGICKDITVHAFENDPAAEKVMNEYQRHLSAYLKESQWDSHIALMMYVRKAAEAWQALSNGDQEKGLLLNLSMACGLTGYDAALDTAKLRGRLPVLRNVVFGKRELPGDTVFRHAGGALKEVKLRNDEVPALLKNPPTDIIK